MPNLPRGGFVQPLLDQLRDAPINFVAFCQGEAECVENDVVQNFAVGRELGYCTPNAHVISHIQEGRFVQQESVRHLHRVH